jgi:hypothetical protein
VKSNLETTCKEIHDLYLDYRYPVHYVSLRRVLAIRGARKAIKVLLKKIILGFKRNLSNGLWSYAPFISRYSCQKTTLWIESLRIENRFDLEVVCKHGNARSFKKSNYGSAPKVSEIKIPRKSKIPVVIYAFNRPNHLKKLLNSIQKSEKYNQFHFIFFLDGARESGEISLVRESREMCENFSATHKTIVASDLNQGLHESIISGLNAVFRTYEFAIVLEDDLECENSALTWFSEYSEYSLAKEDDGGLCGYFPPVLEQISSGSFKCSRFHSWGWATWKRIWIETDFTDQKMLELIISRNFRNEIIETSPDILPIAIAQIAGSIDSWAVKFTISAIHSGYKFRFPGRPLITNNGYGQEATHTGTRRDEIKRGFEIKGESDRIDGLISAYYA